MKRYVLGAIMCELLVSAAFSQTSISIVPQPVKMTVQEGVFAVTSETVIIADAAAKAAGQQLASMLRPATGYPLEIRTDAAADTPRIVLKLDASLEKLGKEGYRLVVSPNQAVISASTPAGIFYGCQTLRQLLPAEIFSPSKASNVKWTSPCVTIEDYPRFVWRGMHLDVCRHFMPKEFVKKYIDLLALHKMNVFHWHLTEDQGWRIEIKKYPKLTEVGAGAKTIVGHYWRDKDRKL